MEYLDCRGCRLASLSAWPHSCPESKTWPGWRLEEVITMSAWVEKLDEKEDMTVSGELERDHHVSTIIMMSWLTGDWPEPELTLAAPPTACGQSWPPPPAPSLWLAPLSRRGGTPRHSIQPAEWFLIFLSSPVIPTHISLRGDTELSWSFINNRETMDTYLWLELECLLICCKFFSRHLRCGHYKYWLLFQYRNMNC